MVNAMRRLTVLLSVLLLTACAARPVVPSGPTPNGVISSGVAEGSVHWGGQIVAVTNLRDRTLVEVLAYPLADTGRPLPEQAAQGRFLVERAGFLEPREYAVGRLIEAEGRLEGFADGRVGDAPYRFPILLADRLGLWDQPATLQRPTSPRINFGVGVSNHGSGVGVGIGF
jgi:outer membrane lipoprotein